jgi:hypothetical protein
LVSPAASASPDPSSSAASTPPISPASSNIEIDAEDQYYVDTTPAASPCVSEGPQKHVIAFWSKHVYFDHKRIKNHRYQ